MTAQDIINNYPRVEYLATDGNWYKLSQMYPICLPVSEELEPNSFHLDTGGHMATCDFFIAKVIGEELHRQCDDGVWRRIAPKVRIRISIMDLE